MAADAQIAFVATEFVILRHISQHRVRMDSATHIQRCTSQNDGR
jgi:hypothetical protein